RPRRPDHCHDRRERELRAGYADRRTGPPDGRQRPPPRQVLHERGLLASGRRLLDSRARFSKMSRMRRFARLPAAERRLLVRMAVVLWGTRLGLWVVSMQTVHRALGRLMPVRAGWRRSVPF